jgi:chromosome partitioning protein
MDGIEEYFDYIVLDSPPSMSMMFVNAIMASDFFLVPLTPEYLAYEGFLNLMKAIGAIRKNMGARVELLGVLFTMVNPLLTKNRKVTREIIKEMERAYGEYVFKTRIVRSAMLCEAPANGQSIFEYAPRSVGARNYEQLAEEVMRRCATMACAARGA